MKESVLRTLVPIVYALLIKWGFASIGVDDNVLQGLASLIVTGVIYVGLRIGERYQSQIGWLLGYAKQPVYVPGQDVSQVKLAANRIERGEHVASRAK